MRLNMKQLYKCCLKLYAVKRTAVLQILYMSLLSCISSKRTSIERLSMLLTA